MPPPPPPPPTHPAPASCFQRKQIIVKTGLFAPEGGFTLFPILVHPGGWGYLATALVHPQHSHSGPLSPRQQNKNKGCLTSSRRGNACVAPSFLFYQKMVQICDLHNIATKPVSVYDFMVSECTGKNKVLACFTLLVQWVNASDPVLTLTVFSPKRVYPGSPAAVLCHFSDTFQHVARDSLWL